MTGTGSPPATLQRMLTDGTENIGTADFKLDVSTLGDEASSSTALTPYKPSYISKKQRQNMTQQQLEEEEEALGDYEVLRYGHHEVMTASGNTYHVKTFFWV